MRASVMRASVNRVSPIRNRRRSNRVAAIALCLQLSLCGAAIADAERDSKVMAVLDQYLDALNLLDLERHVETYHFPHYRHAGTKITVWKNAREAMPILELDKSERRARLRQMLAEDWDRSEWTRREIVQGDANKVHVATTFVRLRKDGSEIASFDSLYVLTFEEGRWAIKGRSSFAP
jgi:hypothetical protein